MVSIRILCLLDRSGYGHLSGRSRRRACTQSPETGHRTAGRHPVCRIWILRFDRHRAHDSRCVPVTRRRNRAGGIDRTPPSWRFPPSLRYREDAIRNTPRAMKEASGTGREPLADHSPGRDPYSISGISAAAILVSGVPSVRPWPC